MIAGSARKLSSREAAHPTHPAGCRITHGDEGATAGLAASPSAAIHFRNAGLAALTRLAMISETISTNLPSSSSWISIFLSAAFVAVVAYFANW
jgi:hypothetical protein